jgi:hypothetical protein
MRKFIYLPATGKRVSINAYLMAWRIVKNNPTKEFEHGLNTWWPQKGYDILRDFRKGLHDRISNRQSGDMFKFV